MSEKTWFEVEPSTSETSLKQPTVVPEYLVRNRENRDIIAENGTIMETLCVMLYLWLKRCKTQNQISSGKQLKAMVVKKGLGQ